MAGGGCVHLSLMYLSKTRPDLFTTKRVVKVRYGCLLGVGGRGGCVHLSLVYLSKTRYDLFTTKRAVEV